MGKKVRRLLPLAVCLAAVLLTLDSNFRIDVREYEISSDRLPAAFDGFRIVQLSDLHAAGYGAGHERLLRAVRGADPDIIVITGDLTDAPGQVGYAAGLTEKLVSVAPVYYVTGNHEWATGEIRELLAALEAAGARTLRNETVELMRSGEHLTLVGLEDPNGPADMATPEEVFGRLGEEAGYTVVLNHRNDRLERLAALGADLILSGHAHGGIVRLPGTDGLIGPSMDWFPTHTSGVYTSGGSVMVVSRGLGNIAPTFRVLNNVHLPVVILRAEE